MALFAQLSEPIDRAALTLMGILGAAIAVGGGSHYLCQQNAQCPWLNRPRVQQFTWENQVVGAQDRAFIVTFDRPMNRQGVEDHLTITPALPGKVSWVGRRLAYTLDHPIPYGTEFTLSLAQAREQYSDNSQNSRQGQVMEPFEAQFRSRDRIFAYIGTQGVEQGRIIVYNLTQHRKTVLTPAGLTVVNFQFYDQGKGIVFAAAASELGFEGLRQLQLYRVPVVETTDAEALPQPTLVLDNQDYQNNQFDISEDGKTIVVQRINRQNPADFDLWMIVNGQKPTRLKVQGGDFQIAPDNQSLAVARGEGIGILPLRPDTQPLDFLPKFGQLLTFSPDGTAAALVNFNMDNAQKRYQRTLFFVNNRGVQKPLIDTDGSIVSCEFGRSNDELYCLITQLLPGENYEEQPYFVKVDIKTGTVFPLLKLQEFRDTQASLSPDGLALLFDQIVVSPDGESGLNTTTGEAIADSQLWLLLPPLNPEKGEKAELNALAIMGFYPVWAP